MTVLRASKVSAKTTTLRTGTAQGRHVAKVWTCGPSGWHRTRFGAPHVVFSASSEHQEVADPFATKEVYDDSDILSKFMIGYFSKVTSKQLGGLPYDGTYEGYVELSREIMKGRNTAQVQELVAGILDSLLPPQSPERFKKWFPLNKRNAEINAWITTLGFKWLVGPSEVQDAEIEFQGEKQVWRSGVKIKKCRYLENSGCVGMCTNMCKLPTQKFFLEKFGLPLTMNPDFETLECEMIFGQAPPPVEEDPVYNQPCFSACNIGSDSKQVCPKIDTDRSQN
ncbi:hypothetical protein M9435_005777 [Picochlorum sp. BPE23]|nr:hypothetical protein M9435_005777 [Picochlorum sp. BPE23]